MRILLIEDDEALATELASALRMSGWALHWARGAHNFSALVRESRFDIAILGIADDEREAVQALVRTREAGCATPIVVLTALSEVEHRVRTLESGADDVLTKPFALSEVVARLRGLMRRSGLVQDRVLQHGPLRMHCGWHRAYLNDDPLELSRREWSVLELLLANAERVVEKDAFVRTLATDDGVLTPNAIEVYIFRVRAKLEAAGLRIRTVRGFGYMLDRASVTDV